MIFYLYTTAKHFSVMGHPLSFLLSLALPSGSWSIMFQKPQRQPAHLPWNSRRARERGEQQGWSSHTSFSASASGFFRAMAGKKSEGCSLRQRQNCSASLNWEFSRASPAFPTGTGACRVGRQRHREPLSFS